MSKNYVIGGKMNANEKEEDQLREDEGDLGNIKQKFLQRAQLLDVRNLFLASMSLLFLYYFITFISHDNKGIIVVKRN